MLQRLWQVLREGFRVRERERAVSVLCIICRETGIIPYLSKVVQTEHCR